VRWSRSSILYITHRDTLVSYDFSFEVIFSSKTPPIAGLHDVVHHFHSTDRFDDDTSPKKKQRDCHSRQVVIAEEVAIDLTHIPESEESASEGTESETDYRPTVVVSIACQPKKKQRDCRSPGFAMIAALGRAGGSIGRWLCASLRDGSVRISSVTALQVKLRDAALQVASQHVDRNHRCIIV
jgi:hypothetical protein